LQPSGRVLQISLEACNCYDKLHLIRNTKVEIELSMSTSFEYTTAIKSWICNSLLKAEQAPADHSGVRQPDRTPCINSGRYLCNLTRLPRFSSLVAHLRFKSTCWHLQPTGHNLWSRFSELAPYSLSHPFSHLGSLMSKLSGNSLSHLTSVNLMLLTRDYRRSWL
jgi:hypothetical protein